MSAGIDQLLTIACSKGASDLHIKAGSFPFIRINGDLQPMVEAQRLSAEDTLTMAFSIMNNRQKQRFSEISEIDIAYGVSGLGRFRCNIFQQRGSVGMVLRVIPTTVRTIEELRLPPVIEKLSDNLRGLLLVTGTTGSGKSTTLASMIDYINRARTGHIVTIEDPIEFLHRDKKSYVNQREIDVDTRSFYEALRGALRQDPDVILVGEMRDRETIETALMASETGHLVLSTLHTLDATETVNRIVSVFPPHQQTSIRLQLASVIRGVISMRLVRAADAIQGRVPAVEVLVATPYIRDCIIYPEKTSLIRDAIAQGTSQYGMQTFDQSLFDLYTRELISYEEALAGATNPDEFKLRVSGVRSTTDQAREDMERSRKRTSSLDVGKTETKQFVNWLLEGKEQVGR
jgi:twitching motility protein PilT